jgi:SAM-dependent methyltransferase
METNAKEHWEKVYATKESDEVSWFQTYPKTSLEFVELFNLPLDAKIIDIGGGDSRLVDTLLEREYKDVTVLDISSNAIEKTKKRLGANANKVKWIVSNIIDFVPGEKYDFWHDRAAFHFLTNKNFVNEYVLIAKKAITENGYLILGTFSEDGPKKCSGLDVRQYSEISMSDKFEDGFKKIKCKEENHLTPFNTVQRFLFCSFQRLTN